MSSSCPYPSSACFLLKKKQEICFVCEICSFWTFHCNPIFPQLLVLSFHDYHSLSIHLPNDRCSVPLSAHFFAFRRQCCLKYSSKGLLWMCVRSFWGQFLAVKLLGQEACVSSAFLDLEDYFPKSWYWLTFPPGVPVVPSVSHVFLFTLHLPIWWDKLVFLVFSSLAEN